MARNSTSDAGTLQPADIVVRGVADEEAELVPVQRFTQDWRGHPSSAER